MGTQTVLIVAGGAVLLILISLILAATLARSGRKRSEDEAAYEAYTAERKAALREAEAEQQARKAKEAEAAEAELARLVAPDQPTVETLVPAKEEDSEEEPETPSDAEPEDEPEEEAEEPEDEKPEEEEPEDEDLDFDLDEDDNLDESDIFEQENEDFDEDELADELEAEVSEKAEEAVETEEPEEPDETEVAEEPERPAEAEEPEEAEEQEEPEEPEAAKETAQPEKTEMLIRTLRDVAIRTANVEPTATQTGEPVSFIAIGKNLFVRQDKRIIGSVRKHSEAAEIAAWIHSGNPVKATLNAGEDGAPTLDAEFYGDPLETAARESLEPVKLRGTKAEEVQAILRELKPGTPCTATFTEREGKDPVWTVSCEAGCIGRLDEDEYEEGRGLAVAEISPSKKDENRLKVSVFVF
ncbi:MAG: hypothetical protein IK127_04910 [Clostridia bacterium]|nr:hypothetical protein [Clostridia bacterium]